MKILIRSLILFTLTLLVSSASLYASDKVLSEGRSSGKFMGMEQGDYTYLIVKTGGGRESFLVLQPDARLEKLLENPDRFVGKNVTVTWEERQVKLPEAGGKVRIKVAVRAELE